MPATALPDLAAAINTRLRSSTAIAAIAGTNVSTTRQPAWNLPAYAVLIVPSRGGGEDTPGLKWERVDVWCYGPGKDEGTQARNAHTLWRTVDYFFSPPISSGRASAFIAASTSVTKVEQEAGPIRLVDPDEGWAYTVGSYRLTYASEPTA